MCPVYSGIGVYSAYAEDAVQEGDEVSSTYEGRHLTFLGSELIGPNALIQKGDPVVVASGAGDIVGVAFKTQVLGSDKIAIDTEGIWMLEVTAVDDNGDIAVVAGDALFIDHTDLSCVISKTINPNTHTLFGYALGNIDSGETAVIAVKVHWGPSPDHIYMGYLGAEYVEAVDNIKRVGLYSSYAGATGGHLVLDVQESATCVGNTSANHLGIRGELHISADTVMIGSAWPCAIQGRTEIRGTFNNGGLSGVRCMGVIGEVWSAADATLTAYHMIGSVWASTPGLADVDAGIYAAFIAYSAGGSGSAVPHAVLYAYGAYRNGIDLTGWVGVPADNHALCLTGSRGYSATGGSTGADVCIANIRVEIAGVTGFVPVLATAV